MIENLTTCPKTKHDERRARQRQARNLDRLARLDKLKKLVTEFNPHTNEMDSIKLPQRSEFGFMDPTPPEAVKLIWTEIRKLERKINLDGGQFERNERIETGL